MIHNKRNALTQTARSVEALEDHLATPTKKRCSVAVSEPLISVYYPVNYFVSNPRQSTISML